eukprot:scaffold45981_cov72-Phaeocystis_antarctica.AAC.1
MRLSVSLLYCVVAGSAARTPLLPQSPSAPLAPVADEPCTNSTREDRCKVTLKMEARPLPSPRVPDPAHRSHLCSRGVPTVCGSQRVAGVLSIQRRNMPDD